MTFRERKERLFKKNPHCYWCGTRVILHNHDEENNILNDNTATLDHIITKKIKKILGYTPHGKTVLSCFKCNRLRGDKTVREFVSCLLNYAYLKSHYKENEFERIISINKNRDKRNKMY
jgi:hypothetical protein